MTYNKLKNKGRYNATKERENSVKQGARVLGKHEAGKAVQKLMWVTVPAATASVAGPATTPAAGPAVTAAHLLAWSSSLSSSSSSWVFIPDRNNANRVTGKPSRGNKLHNVIHTRWEILHIERIHKNLLQAGQFFCRSVPHEILQGGRDTSQEIVA